MRSIEFVDGFNDYESERFRTVGDELASAVSIFDVQAQN